MKIGDKVEIIGNSTGHNFKVGQQVYIQNRGDIKPIKTSFRLSLNKTCKESFVKFDCCWVVGSKDIKEIMKFKVGQKVIVIGNNSYHHFEIGSEMEIVEICDDGYYEAKGVLKGEDIIITQTMKVKDLELVETSLVEGFRLLNEKERKVVNTKFSRLGGYGRPEIDNFRIRFRTKGDFTVCEIQGESDIIFGFSKRNPKDRFNKEIGEIVALANVWD